ncbi:DEAD/DEAH box helicase [Cyclobacterium jeungdonense]|uniref:DEAD/DEAH box helicase n=1 Tax=Cyclobacterium jeungdonense TaxID=708087 RepID=A0ABT8C6U4_9BACT|nr:DEAD/DEAH box helicase [Cyclobacterium jeungdonense]MDN3688235.1 DEAD/DEAH box helicase [Cyclobacterium jeungdonense]
MLSLQQAIEIKESILAYLKATFTFQDKKVHQAFYDFITHPVEGIFKGPYISLRLPFVKANPEEIAHIPLTIKPDWPPYDHQVKAWHRLSTEDKKPEPTLITTGTGSGKTESFLFPVLDYCYHQQNRFGIKVIILYPMNALATDQAERLAEFIHQDERLKGKITAGLFIGEGKDNKNFPTTMGPKNIIENRETILGSPPDILLTNFKMLDYALMKANYHDLWAGNFQDPTLLQFLVLDELHTYDGAQGTDVANLIRRLKLKINVPKNHLCPVGTSATIGSGPDAPQLLAEYASKVFGEAIESECVISEKRQQIEDFFEAIDGLRDQNPSIKALKDGSPAPDEPFEVFVQKQLQIWGLSKENLSNQLRELRIVRDLVEVLNEREGIFTLEQLAKMLSNKNVNYRDTYPQWSETLKFSPKETLIQSLFAIITQAKELDILSGKESPFLFAQTQLWIRELSGVLRAVESKPRFTWKDSVNPEDYTLAMPPWFCRECGASGWLGVKHDNKERFERDVNDVYGKFFENHKHIYFFNETSKFSNKDAAAVGYEPSDHFRYHVSGENLEFHNTYQEGRVDISAFKKINDKGRAEHYCPECNTRNTVAIIGTRIPTLSSIAVSQTLSSDLDGQNEKQRKVLAFTNAVQDAAHQASFVEARNYRFTFRSSLQKVINQQEGALNLAELADQFITYWKTNADESDKHPLDAYYYRFFPTDYLGKASPRDYSDNGKYATAFQREFDHRIRWEIYAEFGYNSLIGRTLEKTGSSGVFFDRAALAQVWEKVYPWLESNEASQSIQKEDFDRFLALVLHRVRNRGGINHPFFDKFREHDLKLWDLNWNKDKRHFLNKRFHPRNRLPKLLTFEKETRGLLDSTFAQQTNWFHSYFKKSFQMASNHVDFVNEFFTELILALESLAVLDRKTAGGQVNFAINPQSLRVSKSVKTIRCDSCEHEVYTPDAYLGLTGGKCLMYRCSGTYSSITPEDMIAEPNYYQLVYNRNRSPRIYAAEHTGLLERKRRELLEKDFKERPRFNSKNVMVATSTLEMGIDIGTLNTAINNSIPPLPSNFLQRIGRAGRKSGSALLVNFAQSKSHDLFYYQAPLDMMAGEVNTPGCYLEAKEILKRHFFAYCIDSWTSADHRANNIPPNIRFMKLSTESLLNEDFFMNRILNFVKSKEAQLFERFKLQYQNEVGDDVFDGLHQSLKSDHYYHSHRSIFENLRKEIGDIQDKRTDLLHRLKKSTLGASDPERKELEAEAKNLSGIISSIRKRNTLEYLTNVGALPNYAFPETGVTLLAKVLGNQAEESTKPPISKDFEIVRSASQAIRELAPENHFYSQSYKFKVSGLNTFGWTDKHNFHQKRFCSICDHLEIGSIQASQPNCPKCGDSSWGAASNLHYFARLTSVKSFNNEADAFLKDDKEDRESVIFHVNRHFDFKANQSAGAWAMKEIPFGIEFVKNVTITDANLGRQGQVDARRIKISNTEVPMHGFVTCGYCGKSTSNIREKDYKFHYGYCKHKNATYQGKPDEVFAEVFLFREIQTEVLKILLPVQDFNSEAEIKMFQAGIELGLKKYFNGNPQHIAISEYREHNQHTGKFDRYLLLFDTVPGGTGYLEKLFDHANFSRMLRLAYHEIRDCSCQHHGKDGCYRCIYSYSNQYYQSDLSRERAEKRFQEIDQKSEAWEAVPQGLGKITASGQIEESELEDRFIRSLKILAEAHENWSIEDIKEDGIVNYTLRYNTPLSSLVYHIRPQVVLGPQDGIRYNTKPDFLFICTVARFQGKEIPDLEVVPRIAVYLDGYQYHASKENNRFANDLQKRKGILESSQYLTWTLTWDDIEKFDSGFLGDKEKQHSEDFLSQLSKTEDFRETRRKVLEMFGANDPIKVYESGNNFDRFLALLRFPIRNHAFFKYPWGLFLGTFQKKLFSPSFDPSDIQKAFFEKDFFDQFAIDRRTHDALIPFEAVPESGLFYIKAMVNLKSWNTYYHLKVNSQDKIDKEAWNSFWILFNMLQFFEEVNESEEVDTELEGYTLEELLSNFPDEVFHGILVKMYQKGFVQSQDDEIRLYSALDESGNTVAEAELIIDSLKVVIGPIDGQSARYFESNGYQLMEVDELNDIAI